jgi:hypothetical protein
MMPIVTVQDNLDVGRGLIIRFLHHSIARREACLLLSHSMEGYVYKDYKHEMIQKREINRNYMAIIITIIVL